MDNQKQGWLSRMDRRTAIPDYVKPLFDYWIRDTFITFAPDGFYYLTGTTRTAGQESAFLTNDGIELWRSPDLKRWEHLGLVWSFERDATWQKEFKYRHDDKERKQPYRALYAPEIQLINGWYYITASINWPAQEGELGNSLDWPNLGGKKEFSRTFLLRSRSAAGPYEDAGGGPMTTRIDSSLFIDDDATVYYVWQDGRIAKMKPDMTGFAEEPRAMLQEHYAPEPYCEGAFLFKHAGLYHLLLAIWVMEKDGSYGYFPGERENKVSYDCVIASSDSPYGPYGKRYTAISGGGHNNLFADKQGRICATMFGNPVNESIAPFYAKPAYMRMAYGKDGRFYPIQSI
jgi:beta-xylosidase